jgi:hypothetical protein
MFLKDGRGWFNEYFNHHMFNRFGRGVHGDRGTFDYFASQIGIGMWPWIALLPAALATVLLTGGRHSNEGRVRLLVGIWAIAGVATFCASETKFHHYILPAVPALAMLIAFWLDDYIQGRVKAASLMILAGVPIIGLIARDFSGEQKQLIELFIYRYDRPWPSGEPWFVDASSPFLWFGLAFALILAVMAFFRTRVLGAILMLAAALGFAGWAMNAYMGAAAPHWGQRELHRTYYQNRAIHGVDIQYFGLGELARDFGSDAPYRVRSVLPQDFKKGLPMTVNIMVPGAGIPGDAVKVQGDVSEVGDNEFYIAIHDAERAKLAELIERGKKAGLSGREPIAMVNADRLLAWQLNWRGENFWSGGEIYGPFEDTKTVFMETDNKKFLEWLKKPERANRTFYVITEASRGKGLKNILPTPRAKETLETLDSSCNKFTLLRFSL